MNGPRVSSPTSRYGDRFGPTERRRSEYRMPRFFKRSSKLPDALSSMLTMWQALQVPSDGLRNSSMGDDTPDDCAKEGVQVNLLPETYRQPPSAAFTLNLTISRDAQQLAPTRPSLHLPPLVLPPAHEPSLVPCLHTTSSCNSQACIHVRIRPLPPRLPSSQHSLLLPRWSLPGSRSRRSTRSQATTRPIRSTTSFDICEQFRRST